MPVNLTGFLWLGSALASLVCGRSSVSDPNLGDDSTWGPHKSRTRPVPGNHDYGTLDAGPYFDYFEWPIRTGSALSSSAREGAPWTPS